MLFMLSILLVQDFVQLITRSGIMYRKQIKYFFSKQLTVCFVKTVNDN